MNFAWALILVTGSGSWDSGLRFDSFVECDSMRYKAIQESEAVQPHGGFPADNDTWGISNMRCLPVKPGTERMR